MIEHVFPAMGGTVEVQIAHGDAAGAGAVEALFERYERAMSRFRADSELNALNASATQPFAASPLLFDIVNEAAGWACITDGVFDPTVIDALEASGYDRPFASMPARTAVLERPCARTGRWRAIAFDFERETITLPSDVRIDLGGIGKGYTVDRAISALGAGANALVNASGDLYAAGDGPDGDGWYVGVQDPLHADEDLVVLNVNDRGVATSGSTRRNWLAGDERYHHLIDPRFGRPSASDLLTVTVIAMTATQADVLAKAAFLLGAGQGMRFIERFYQAECIAVTTAGDLVTTSGAGEYFA